MCTLRATPDASGPDRSGVRRNNPSSARGNRRTSGISIPHALAARAYRYSLSPMSRSSWEEANFTIQSSPSMLVSTFGRAPPNEPPIANNVSRSWEPSAASTLAHSRASSSKSVEVAGLVNGISGTYSSAPMPLNPTMQAGRWDSRRTDRCREIEATDRPANAPIRRASCRQTRRTRRRADVAAQRKRAFPAEG